MRDKTGDYIVRAFRMAISRMWLREQKQSVCGVCDPRLIAAIYTFVHYPAEHSGDEVDGIVNDGVSVLVKVRIENEEGE